MKLDRALLARIGRLRIASAGLASGRGQGERAAAAVGAGVSFADHRPYAPGDDLRHVDWNIYARLDQLLVRLYHEDREQTVAVVVDASGSMGTGARAKLDHAGDLAACLCLVGLLGRDAVRLVIVGASGGPVVVEGRDPAALPRFLSALEAAEPGGALDTRTALIRAARRARTDQVFLLSDMLLEGDDQEAALRALAATSGRAVLLQVLGEEDLRPALEDAVRLVDAETGAEQRVGGGPEVTAAYAAALAAFQEGLAVRCRRFGVRLVEAHADRPVETVLLEGLRRAGVLRGRAS
jgi:uncharacterized protein (DUF58 family)